MAVNKLCLLQECNNCGARKVLGMLASGWQLHPPKWFLKIEDSVYISPGHALQASHQWTAMHAEYVGCIRHARPVESFDEDAVQVWEQLPRFARTIAVKP